MVHGGDAALATPQLPLTIKSVVALSFSFFYRTLTELVSMLGVGPKNLLNCSETWPRALAE